MGLSDRLPLQFFQLIAKKRQNAAQRGDSGNNKGAQKEEKGQQEVTQWTRIMRSLGTTRAIISPDERRRLDRMYSTESSRLAEMARCLTARDRLKWEVEVAATEG
jgi:hypothetical protein